MLVHAPQNNTYGVVPLSKIQKFFLSLLLYKDGNYHGFKMLLCYITYSTVSSLLLLNLYLYILKMCVITCKFQSYLRRNFEAVTETLMTHGMLNNFVKAQVFIMLHILMFSLFVLVLIMGSSTLLTLLGYSLYSLDSLQTHSLLSHPQDHYTQLVCAII